MAKLINGWTKETVMAQVKKYNNGSRSVTVREVEYDEYNTACVYLSPDLNRCLIGCFIPDNHEALKSPLSACALIRYFPDLKDKMPFGEYDLQIFQSVHDESVGRSVYDAAQEFLDVKVE